LSAKSAAEWHTRLQPLGHCGEIEEDAAAVYAMPPNTENNDVIDPISWEFAWPYMLAALAGGYFFGSIPFGLILTKVAGLGDVRNIGSGNIGATNVLRTGRKGLAALTLLLDTAKGTGAVLVGAQFGPDVMIVAALGALIGHLFPVWLKFRGGKGVATAAGVMLALAWQPALICIALWLLILVISRYSTLAALIATLCIPPLTYWLATPQIAEFSILVTILVWSRHIPNIRRLLKGTESRIGG
jgi:glycerol-3-phosphate acyltransferase PlsY